MTALGAHMIPCRTCLAAPTFVCQHDSCYDDEVVDGFHAQRQADVDVLNEQITDKLTGESRWHLARPASDGGVIFVVERALGKPLRTFMAGEEHDAERLAILLERSDRIRDRMRDAGYFDRGPGGLFSGGDG